MFGCEDAVEVGGIVLRTMNQSTYLHHSVPRSSNLFQDPKGSKAAVGLCHQSEIHVAQPQGSNTCPAVSVSVSRLKSVGRCLDY